MTKETYRAAIFMWAAMVCTTGLVAASASQPVATIAHVATLA